MPGVHCLAAPLLILLKVWLLIFQGRGRKDCLDSWQYLRTKTSHCKPSASPISAGPVACPHLDLPSCTCSYCKLVSFPIGLMASSPVIDSPKTPKTPLTPPDITLNKEEGPAPAETISYADCLELAKKVKYCSKSLIEGSWREGCNVRGRRPRFIPANFEAAKAFLRASVEVIPSRRIRRSVSDTPMSTRSRLQPSPSPDTSSSAVSPSQDTSASSDSSSQPDMGICHKCHTQMGQDRHLGSAPGKNVCTLQHSHFCKGGIVEDDSWKACPVGYFLNPNIQLASESGFEGTMVTADFQPQSSHSGGPAFSTPAISRSGLVSTVPETSTSSRTHP